jgi:hypothetical protein
MIALGTEGAENSSRGAVVATAQVRRITVNGPDQMQVQITHLMAQGFLIANQSNHSVTMIKRKEFSILWLVIGLLLCVIPLFIYLIIYALESDQIVEIAMVGSSGQPYPTADSSALPTAAGAVQLSPDGQAWWDGTQWQSTATSCPPHATRSPDGAAWWDGRMWRPMPGTGSAPQA